MLKFNSSAAAPQWRIRDTARRFTGAGLVSDLLCNVGCKGGVLAERRSGICRL
jgi:hypothetical protein